MPKTPGQITYETQDGPGNFAWHELNCITQQCWEIEAARSAAAAPGKSMTLVQQNQQDWEPYIVHPSTQCWKCQGSRNMGFTMFVTCDAC